MTIFCRYLQFLHPLILLQKNSVNNLNADIVMTIFVILDFKTLSAYENEPVFKMVFIQLN